MVNLLRTSFSLLSWLMDLFNAPPRDEMTARQKIGRIFFVTGTMLMLSLFSAMFFGVCIFIAESVTEAFRHRPDLWNTVSIITLGIVVNAGCVYLLFVVRRLDRKLMLAPGETPARP